MIFGGEEEEDGGLGEEAPPPPVFPKRLDLRFKDPKVSQGLEIDPEGTRVTSSQSTPAVLILSEACNPEPYTREDFPEDELPGLYEESYRSEPLISEQEVSQGDAGSQQVDEEGQEDLFDAIAASNWRDTVRACQKYRDELTSLNWPAVDECGVEPFVFAGFVKPGRHVLIVYDPDDQEFYRRDIVVEVRSGDIYVEDDGDSGNQKGRGKDEELFERDDFIFKDWRKDTPESLHAMYRTDLDSEIFSSLTMGTPERWYSAILDYISNNYQVFLDAYKVYLTRTGFPTTNFVKFMDFLINLNIVRPNDDDSTDVLRVDQAKKIFLNEVNERQLDAKIIYRGEFIQKIFAISYQNFKNTRMKAHWEFVKYLNQNVLSTMRSYIKRFGKGFNRFRKVLLWK